MADEKTKILLIKSILAVHASNGADIHTIRREYMEIENEPLERSHEEATALMWRIPDVYNNNGRYFSKSAESRHIAKFVTEQRQKPAPPKRRYSCYFDRDRVGDDESHTKTSQNFGAARNRSPVRPLHRTDNKSRSRSTVRPSSNGYANHSRQSRTPSPPPTQNPWRPQNDASSVPTRDPRVNNNFDRENERVDETMFRQTTATQQDVQIQQFAVIADDFIFSLILERTQFGANAQHNDEMLTPKWSYCVVGQTIADAVTLIKQDQLNKPLEPTRVIVNIGAVDICRGTTFRQMAEDFVDLIKTCATFNMEPTITTVLPFSASPNAQEIAWKVHTFNNFLKENFDHVIDLWSCFAIGLSRSLGNLFHLNGIPTRFAGRDSDIAWINEQMRLEHRGKSQNSTDH